MVTVKREENIGVGGMGSLDGYQPTTNRRGEFAKSYVHAERDPLHAVGLAMGNHHVMSLLRERSFHQHGSLASNADLLAGDLAKRFTENVGVFE